MWRCFISVPENTAVDMNQRQLSIVLISLFKGIVYRDTQPDLWQTLLTSHNQVRDHVALFGLELMIDEVEGFAHLRQHDPVDEENALPRLIARRQLSYRVSLLLALLRKRLIEHDTTGDDPRLIVTRDDIADMVRLFLPDTTDEVSYLRRITTDINRIIELGFLRKLRGQDDQFEVLRILVAFVDAQWLGEFEARLEDYRRHADDEEDA